MDLSINTSINIFKDNISNVIGTSNLPVGIAYYVLKDILSEIETLYNTTLEKEQQELLNSISSLTEEETEKVEEEKENIEEN